LEQGCSLSAKRRFNPRASFIVLFSWVISFFATESDFAARRFSAHLTKSFSFASVASLRAANSEKWGHETQSPDVASPTRVNRSAAARALSPRRILLRFFAVEMASTRPATRPTGAQGPFSEAESKAGMTIANLDEIRSEESA
jgi:hypothetical protein